MKSLFKEFHALPILAPANIVATATGSQYIDLKYAQSVTFAVQFGALTSDTTDTCTVTVECSTAASSNATELKIGFTYRLSAAVATDTLGAPTAATTDGVAITADDDNKTLFIDLDPQAVANLGADYRFARVFLTPNAEMAACTVGAIAYIVPRYAQVTPPSST
jgi:hypothetical protein